MNKELENLVEEYQKEEKELRTKLESYLPILIKNQLLNRQETINLYRTIDQIGNCMFERSKWYEQAIILEDMWASLNDSMNNIYKHARLLKIKANPFDSESKEENYYLVKLKKEDDNSFSIGE